MGISAGPWGTGLGERVDARTSGVALLPVWNIPDRATIAYEALPRPGAVAPPALVEAAFAAAQHSSPALMMVPLPASLMHDPRFDPAALAHDAGVAAAEVAWLVTCPESPPYEDFALRTARLRAAGFQVALEAKGWAIEQHERIIEVRPDFLMLDAATVATLRHNVAAGAELAGLLSFATRLEVRCIARGVDDQATAYALTSLGLQHGSGAYLAPPVVLDEALGAAGDVAVGPAWFRHHEPRRLEAVGRPTLLPTQVLSLPESDPAGETGSDRFAQFLGEAARLLQAEHDPGRILRIAGDILPRAIPVSALVIFEADWDSDMLIPRVVAGTDVVTLRDAPFPMSRGITGWAFARGEPYNCGNTVTHPAAGTVPGTEGDLTPESLLVVPLIAGDHRVGVLDVWRRGSDEFSQRDLEHFALFAHVIAAAWHNAQLYSEVESRARTDSLTGLHNTRWWDEVAPQEAARSVRSGAEIGVLLLDLDHFKLVNDTGGHAAGDHALRNVARVLRSTVRTGDDVVRFGGEEFLILLHESGTEGALRVAEDLRMALYEMPPAVPGVRVTASIGVAVFPLHGSTLDDVVRAADLAMYRAKKEGRDRVVPAADPGQEAVEAS